MAVDLSKILVIGVSSRALFDLEAENLVFSNDGIKAYQSYQLAHENEPLKKGTAYVLVERLLNLNKQANQKIVEVIVMSKNSPETGVRMLNSITQHKLDITRVALSGGEPLSPYIDAFDIDLFLSKDQKDVQDIIDSNNCAAALLYAPPIESDSLDERVKIAFDADAVLFSDDSEFRYKKEGLEEFHKYEAEHENDPLAEGPFAKLLIKLSSIQKLFISASIEKSPLRLAIVTARSAPSHMRVIKTLRKWGVYVDEAYFLGGLSKDKILKAFEAHIFFDDQDTHLIPASKVVPSGRVPYKSNSKLRSIAIADLKVIPSKGKPPLNKIKPKRMFWKSLIKLFPTS